MPGGGEAAWVCGLCRALFFSSLGVLTSSNPIMNDQCGVGLFQDSTGKDSADSFCQKTRAVLVWVLPVGPLISNPVALAKALKASAQFDPIHSILHKHCLAGSRDPYSSNNCVDGRVELCKKMNSHEIGSMMLLPPPEELKYQL